MHEDLRTHWKGRQAHKRSFMLLYLCGSAPNAVLSPCRRGRMPIMGDRVLTNRVTAGVNHGAC